VLFKRVERIAKGKGEPLQSSFVLNSVALLGLARSEMCTMILRELFTCHHQRTKANGEQFKLALHFLPLDADLSASQSL
jgi:hypothetical protein